MRARDVVGRRIVGVRQRRSSTRWDADGVERASDWEVFGLELEGGRWLALTAIETDGEPIVTAKVVRRL